MTITTPLDNIREKIKKLASSDPIIHINASLQSPRLTLKNAEAKITGIYKHLFLIEESSTGRIRRHTLQYTDILTNQVEIIELSPDRPHNP